MGCGIIPSIAERNRCDTLRRRPRPTARKSLGIYGPELVHKLPPKRPRG